MRLLSRSRVAAFAVAAAALTTGAAGCASAAAPASSSSPAAPRPAAASATPTMTFGPANGTPKQRAVADAAVLVKQFIPPPGAHQRAKSPVPSSPVSSGPQGGGPEDQDVITRTGWWLAPGGPLALLSWEKAHLGKVYRYEGSEENGPGIYSNTYDVPPVPGLFDYRHLAVTAVAAGHGQVALRVDALVDWIPARAKGDTVPATARRAVLTETKSVVGTAKAPVANATIVTNAKEVAALAAYLNHLPVNVPGRWFSCPAAQGNGGGLSVLFQARSGGPALALATADLGGCGFLTYTMPGHPPTGLGEAEAGLPLLAEVNHVTGSHWKVP